MSHDIFLQAHMHGGSQKILTSEVLKCFSEFIAYKHPTYIDVEFTEEDSSTIFFKTTRKTITGMMVNRPCGDRGLARCLFRVMQLGNFVLFEGGAERFIVLREEVIPHLPEGMAEALGEARITPDIDSFIEAYENPCSTAHPPTCNSGD
jgi:hypothetical protein